MQPSKLLVSFLILTLLAGFSSLPPQANAQTYLFSFSKWDSYFRIPSFSIIGTSITSENTTDHFQFNVTLNQWRGISSFSVNIQRVNLEFYYQSPLNEELNVSEYTFVNATHAMNGTEVLVYRPENVVGSYAVYCNYQNNQYGTGKVFHLYRPLLIDANGNRLWGTLNVTDSVLTVSANATWLQNAVYPVVVDPTFGYTTAGASYEDGDAANVKFGCQYACSEAGILQSITAYLYNDVSGTLYTAIYSDSSDTPSTLLETQSRSCTATVDWFTWTGYTTTLEATNYWLTLCRGSNYLEFHYDTASTYRARINSDTPPPESTFGSGSDTTNRRYSIYATYETTKFPYVQQVSDVDSSADIGTHSNFAAQQAGPDSTNDTLTEGNYGGSSSNTTMLNDGFESGLGNWDGNGATTWDTATSATYGSPWAPHGGTYFMACDSNDDGSLTTDDIDMSTATAIYVSFWYMEDDVDDADEFNFRMYDGSGYDKIQELGLTASEDTWYQYSARITDSQYFKSNFRVDFIGTTIGTGEVCYIDDVVVIREVTAVNYQLALEEQFTEVPHDGDSWTNGELCVFTGPYTGTAEDLQAQVWNGSAWTTVSSSLTTNAWNNISVLSYVTADDLYIRFIGGTESSDTAQNTWQIDAVLMHLWIGGEQYVAALSQSVTATYNLLAKTDFRNVYAQSITSTWSMLVKSTFSIIPVATFTFGWATNIIHGMSVSLSLAATTTWNILVKWSATATLTQTLTSTWNMLLSWAAKLTLTQSITISWNILIKSAFSILTSVGLTFSWLLDIIKSVGAFHYIADFSLAISTAWNALVKWTVIVNLSQTLSTSWNVLVQSAFNLQNTLSLTFSWIMDIFQGAQNVVVLTLSVLTEWSMTVSIIPLNVEETVATGIIIALIVGVPVAVSVAWLMFKQRN